VEDPEYFATVFEALQQLIKEGRVIAGHDISAGGMIVTLLEMCFANRDGGIAVNLTEAGENDTVRLLFSQNPGVIIQDEDESATEEFLYEKGIRFASIGHPVRERKLFITNGSE